jgi:hypothetical protein
MDSASIDLMLTGNHIYEPYSSVGEIPDEYFLTVIDGGNTFSGTVYITYAVPNIVAGIGGVYSVSFDENTTSPIIIFTPPNNSVITKCIIVADTAALTGTPTCSLGTLLAPGRDMATTDSDLLTLGTYIYEPYTACSSTSGSIYLTLTGHESSGVEGRAYIKYMMLQ